jgi:hypothetical protein
MVCNIQNYWVFGLFPSSDILENHDVSEIDPVSETSRFYSLEYRTMEKVQNASNSI